MNTMYVGTYDLLYDDNGYKMMMMMMIERGVVVVDDDYDLNSSSL